MTTDRTQMLSRLVGRPGPRHPDADRIWQRLDPIDRDRLRWVSTDPDAAMHLDDDRARFIVDQLAADRTVRTRTTTWAPLLTGLLVLSTVWGFGRAAFPATSGWYLTAGLAGLVLTALLGWRRAARARAVAHEVRRVLRR